MYMTPTKKSHNERLSNFHRSVRKKRKNKDKQEDNKKKDEDNTEDKGFQQPKGTVTIIFSSVSGSRSKHQDKLALRSIMAAEPAVPRYLSWS
jgi:hypothetical protein